VYGSLEASIKPTAGCVFRAVTFGTTVADAVRRPTKYGDLVEICGPGSREPVAKAIDAFGPRGCQFLTSDVQPVGGRLPDEAWIDIAHESLIRQWKRLSAWLAKEGDSANEWRRLKENAEHEGILRGRALSDAIAFRKESKPTPGWAIRYGGDFDKVIRLIRKSEWRQRLRFAVGGSLVAAGLIAAYLYYQMNQYARVAAEHAQVAAHIADRNFALAVSSAQTLLDQVSKSFTHGDLSINGANVMLQVAKKIVHDAHSMEKTPETAALLIKLQHSFSDIYAELGNISLAFENAKSAKELAQPLLAADANNPKALQSVYASTWRMGDAISYQGGDRAHQEQALAEYLQAQQLARRLAEMAPGDGARQRELMFIDQKIGDVEQALGALDKAVATYRTALGIIEKVSAAVPKNRNWRRDVANSRRRIGQALAANKDFDGALEEFNAAIEILADLEKLDFRDTITKSNLATVHRQAADVYAQRVDWTTAAAEYAAAFAIQERLIAADRDNATWQYSLASLYAGMGSLLQRQGDLAGALQRYRQAHDIRQALAVKDPTNPARQNNLAKAAIAVADVLTAQKVNLDEATQKANLDEAEKLYRRAIEVQELVLPRHDDDVFDCYVKIGDIRLSQEDREGALTEYTRAWSIANDTVADDRTSVAWRRRLTASYIKIGDLLVTIDRPAEAREQYQEALKIVTDLAAKNPQNGEWTALGESLKMKIQAIRA
jgi:tetratricopeptide (TPR) repeat protein